MEDSSQKCTFLSLPTEIIELIVCRLDSPALLATILTNKQLMKISGPLFLHHITIHHQLWNGPHFGPPLRSFEEGPSVDERQEYLVKFLEENPEKAASVVSYTERILKWEKYPMGPPNSREYCKPHAVSYLSNLQHLSITIPSGLFWSWRPGLVPIYLYKNHNFPHLKTRT